MSKTTIFLWVLFIMWLIGLGSSVEQVGKPKEGIHGLSVPIAHLILILWVSWVLFW